MAPLVQADWIIWVSHFFLAWPRILSSYDLYKCIVVKERNQVRQVTQNKHEFAYKLKHKDYKKDINNNLKYLCPKLCPVIFIPETLSLLHNLAPPTPMTLLTPLTVLLCAYTPCVSYLLSRLLKYLWQDYFHD